MKHEILTHQTEPAELEKLYRSNRSLFRKEFKQLYNEIGDKRLAEFWHERLKFESNEDITWGSSRELAIVLIIALTAGLVAKVPALFSIEDDFFYPRNIGFIVFPALSIYFAWKNRLSAGKIAFIAGASLAGLIYINSLPNVNSSDTLILSCIHLILFLWSLLGFAFVGSATNSHEKRLWFLKYNGDLVVMTALILLAGGIMSLITVGLFELIGIDIKNFYVEYVVVFGLAAAPVAGTYLTQTNPQLVGKVSPVIAKIFSPLVLVMLVIYLAAMIYSGKNPYNDRQFLIVFNALLVGVMAIIFFSVAETTKSGKNKAEIWILFLLSAVTIAVNGIALSAIIFRISEFGITPNRMAVLGGNVLILLNLAMVTRQLFMTLQQKAELSGVGRAIAYCLPIYFVWTIIVTFLFPFLFGFS